MIAQWIVAALVGVIGIVLVVLFNMIDNVSAIMSMIQGPYPSSTDVSKKLAKDFNNARNGVLVLAVLFIILPITFALCHFRCECGTGLDMSVLVYMIIFLLLGVTLIGLGATVNMNLDKLTKSQNLPDKEKKAVDKARQGAVGVWVTGLILTLITAGYIGFLIFKKVALKKSKFASCDWNNKFSCGGDWNNKFSY